MREHLKKLKNSSLEISSNFCYHVQLADGRLETAWSIVRCHYSEHTYYVKNFVCLFAEGDSIYLTHYSEETLEILRANKFRPEECFIPFLDGSKPVWSETVKTKWATIRQLAFLDQQKVFELECRNASAKKGFNELPTDLVFRMIKIPKTGLKVLSGSGVPYTYFPDGAGCDFNSFFEATRLCQYNQSQNAVIVIAPDGNSYFSPDVNIGERLGFAGYTRNYNLYPLMTTEKAILDPEIQARWTNLKQY